MMTVEVWLPAGNRELLELLDVGYFGGRVDVIECRVYSRECFGAEDLFLIQGTVWFSKLCVPFGRKFSETVVTRQSCHSELFSGRITLFLKTPSLSISSSTVSPGFSQGCTSCPSSKRDPVPTVPDPNISPG